VKQFFSFLSLFKKLAAFLGVVSLFLGLLVRFFLPDLTMSVSGLLLLALILWVMALIGARGNIKDFLHGRRGRTLLNTTVMVILFIAVLGLANVLGLIKHRRFDLTSSGTYTLAPQTIRVIKGLKEPLKVIGFFPNDAQFDGPKRQAQELLEEYAYWNKKLKFTFVDPESRPALARRYGIKYYGTFVFVSPTRQKLVLKPAEEAFTNALLEVSGTQAKKIYFLTGNGEHDLNGGNGGDYDLAKKGMIRDLYQVEPLDLTADPRIPEDCAVLILAGTKKAWPPEEIKTIEIYLQNGGKLLLLIDPNPPAEVGEILGAWGLSINPGHVIDQSAYVSPDPATPAVFKGHYPPVVITTDLDTTYFPEAASFGLSPELSRALEGMKKEGETKESWPVTAVQYRNLVILPLILTSPSSRMEQGGKETPGLKKNNGPLALGAMIIGSSPLGSSTPPVRSGKKDQLTRLVVLGDSDFASNEHIRNGGNADLFLNAVNWLAEEEQLISVRPKPYSNRRLLISQKAIRFIRYSSLGLLPLFILVLAGVIWWKKR
jgi:gliding motility-associatede transport system auxiliary component